MVVVVVVVVVYLSICLSVYLSVYLSNCNLQDWKRSNSVRLPQLLNLIASKSKQFCETSSIFRTWQCQNFLNFRSWQHQKRSNSARLPSLMESWMQSWRPRTNAFCVFSSPCLWSIAPATKKWCQVTQSAAPVTQNHLPKTEDLMLQNATTLRKSAPWPPNISDEHVSCTAPATENASFQILFKCPTLAIDFGSARKPSRFAHFWPVAQSLAPATRNDIWTPKVPRTRHFFCTFDCIFRHLNFQKCSGPGVFCTFWLGNVLCATTDNGVHFFDISTSKSAPALVCFCTFWLGIVLRATMVCTFSTSQLPNVAQTWGAVYILTSKCASRHNGMQLFISHLATWLRTRRFSEPTLRPSGATNHWKNTVFRDFATFSRTCNLLSSHSFSYLIFSLLLLCSLTLPTSAFLSVHIVGSLTSKLPSTNIIYLMATQPTPNQFYHWGISQISSLLAVAVPGALDGAGTKKMESAGSNLHLSYTTHTHRNITLKRILWNHALYMGDMRWVMSATKYKG